MPETLNHFQQFNFATLSGVASPGVSRANALNYLKGLAARTLPAGYTLDYAGPSRQFVQESTGVVGTFGFAGGASRYAVGLVISTGLGIGTLVHGVRRAGGLCPDRRHSPDPPPATP